MAQHPVANTRLIAARIACGWHTQEDFAEAYDAKARDLRERARISVRQIRRWESGQSRWPNKDARRVLAALFGKPLEDLGFIRPTPNVRGTGAPTVELEDDLRRRTFLGTVLTVPMLDLDALDHLTAATTNAHRYTDHELVAQLSAALDDAARSHGSRGPHQALPATLGILAAVHATARDARDEVRRALLQLGARGAELAAWLHKDAGAPVRDMTYWHQQSKEWATLTGDGPMHAYVLLRQAQASDRTDAARMLDLARAAITGPWTLPPRPRAEALQQEARALAMTGHRISEVERTLDRAHQALDQAAAVTDTPTVTGPLGDSYTRERLMVQAAICYREAGALERAVTVFQQHLSLGVFAPRDRAFFTAQLSGALAAAGEPDEAARTALQVLPLAAGARFGQALGELYRTAAELRPYANRPAVAELRQGLAALAV